MLFVTDAAQEAVQKIIKEKGLDLPVRIYMESACEGGSLAMRLDAALPSDQQYELEGVTYLINQSLDEKLGEVHLDYLADAIKPGFDITATGGLPGSEACGVGCSC